MEKNEIINLVLKNVNVPGLAFDLIDEVLEKALQKVVDNSSNKFDDMLMAAIYPTLEKELKELIQKKYDELIEKLSQ